MREGTKSALKKWDSFDMVFGIYADDVDFELIAPSDLEYANFLINPRRLRGSDFLMRWSQGRWTEHRILESVNATGEFFAIPYGPSGTAPDDNVREFELYFERLEKAGLGSIKRPDLLVFPLATRATIGQLVAELGGEKELPFTSENSTKMRRIISLALAGVECENSLWVAERMPGYGQKLRPMARLRGKLGLPKGAVVPTIIIKDEDFSPLSKWQTDNKKPIHVWHAFYDVAYGLAFDDAKRLVKKGLVEPRSQVFQAPGGATTEKITYNFPYHYAYRLARTVEQPTLVAACLEDKNGHILPYVHFEGGRLEMSADTLQVLRGL
jgi:hypothetical protein